MESLEKSLENFLEAIREKCFEKSLQKFLEKHREKSSEKLQENDKKRVKEQPNQAGVGKIWGHQHRWLFVLQQLAYLLNILAEITCFLLKILGKSSAGQVQDG